MGTLEITIIHPSGPATVYRGEAEWITGATTMTLESGPGVEGYGIARRRGVDLALLRLQV